MPRLEAGEPVVGLAGVRLRYGKAEALRGVDLEIPGGGWLA